MNLELQKGSRSKVLASIVVATMTLFVIRLFYIQIIQHDYYSDIANSEQVKKLTIPAKRGLIYALDGDTPTKLVMNESVYTLFVDPKIVDEPDKVLVAINKLPKEKLRDGYESLLAKTETRYQILAKKLTRTEADKIKSENLKGVGFQEVSQRVYPEGAMAAQVLGFVDFEGVGKYGVEGDLNTRLTGVDGLLQSVTDIRDVPLTIGNQNVKIPKKDGDNIVLSIDRNIQSKVETALIDGLKRNGAQKGSVIVMDPNSGRVMAMANLPSYSPASFNTVEDGSLFNNPIVSMQYEPGSVVKSFTLAKAIDRGTVTPQTTYNNTDSVVIEDRTISNATKGHTGNITMQDAYTWSLNTGMVEVMKLLGGGSITSVARQILYGFFHDDLGFGSTTGVELSGEIPGIIISPEDSEGGAVRYSNMSFGQGFDATMLQVAAAYSSVINGGTYYQPTMLAGTVLPSGEYKKDSAVVKRTGVVKASTSATMRQMAATVRATALGSHNPDRQGYLIGGKTGTSQVIENGHYLDNETIGSYIGFGGADTPEYVIMVMVSGKGQTLGGARDAGPIFTDISNWLIDYLKIQPKG